MWAELQKIGVTLQQTQTEFQRTASPPQIILPQNLQIESKIPIMWTKEQRIRLAVENKVLASKASQFGFHKHKLPTETYVAGWIKTSDGHKYELKVLLGPKFSDKMPHLLLTSPDKAAKYGGGLIVNEGISHRFHSRGEGPGGFLEICHCEESSWDPSRNILSVLIKGAIWCEAHCRHLKSGISIAKYCDELKDQVPDLNNY